MQPASKSKTWANEDLYSFGQTSMAVPQVVAVAEAGESDDEYEAIPAKQKKSKSSQAEGGEKSAPVAGGADVKLKGVEGDAVCGDAVEDTSDAPGPVSDTDWLRSKMSRLLDLTDDVDSHLARVAASATITTKQTVQEGDEWNGIDEEMDKREKAQSGEESKEVSTTEEEVAIETISKSGRLFLRNLTYSTTEDDLREYFVEHGELEEVRFFLLCQ